MGPLVVNSAEFASWGDLGKLDIDAGGQKEGYWEETKGSRESKEKGWQGQRHW